MYEKDLARIGKPLFQRRKYASTAVILAGAAVMMLNDQPAFADALAHDIFFLCAIILAVGGEAVRIATSGLAALGTSGEGKAQAQAAELNTTGMYSLVRNPLYVGRVLNFTGIALFTGFWEYGAIVFLATILYYERVIAYEEQFLTNKFGQAYEDWCNRVPGFFPRFSGWIKPVHGWWWRRLFFREGFKVLDLAAALTAYTLLRQYAISGVFVIPPEWKPVLAVIALGYVTMVVLRRFTRVFRGIS